MSRQDFINKIAPLIIKYPSPLLASIRIAQACLESADGTSELAVKANNLFGIKASAPWTGTKYAKESYEWVDGMKQLHTSDFRRYDTWEDSIKDHANFITSTPRRIEFYGKAIAAQTYIGQAGGLTGTYATDPEYGAKLIKIIEEYDLTQYDKEDKMAKLTLEQAFAKLGLPFKKQLLPLTKTYGRVNSKKGIVIHQTGAPQKGKNAQWMANYQASMSRPGNREEKSWNYQCDDTQVIMSFEHDVATWQASDGKGPGNMAHISIESCINADGNYAKGIDNLAKTMAVIAYVEGFNIERQTKRHYDFARDKKWCPAQIMNGKEGFTYSKVKAMAQAHLNTLKGAVPVSTANPQGLETSKIPSYKAPALAFDRLAKGSKATFRDPWNWYDDGKKEFIHSKKHDELVGTQFTVEEIKNIEPIGYSKFAYKSKEHNSWILEQDIVEARDSWKVEEVDSDLKDEGKDAPELKEGQFWIGDTLYQVTEIS